MRPDRRLWAIPTMCFSATASFLTAAATAAAGLACLSRVRRPGEALLAATPLVFAGQQALEGWLWLRLPDGSSGTTGLLTAGFLFLAQVVWPTYAPAAALLAERDAKRRMLMAPVAAAGLGVSAYLLWALLTQPHSATLAHDHIAYDMGAQAPYLLAGAYVTAVSLPLLLSSHRAIQLLGAIVLAGAVTALVFYYEAFQSVWCYFAAAASVVLLGHFAWQGRRGPAVAAAPLADL